MKVRVGFVSNSSSSSFLINKKHLTARQIELIKDHLIYGKQLGIQYCDEYNEWEIREYDNMIGGDTMMDNFDMHYYLEEIGIADEHIKWDDENSWDDGDSDNDLDSNDDLDSSNDEWKDILESLKEIK
jgi:hypothetical protein